MKGLKERIKAKLAELKVEFGDKETDVDTMLAEIEAETTRPTTTTPSTSTGTATGITAEDFERIVSQAVDAKTRGLYEEAEANKKAREAAEAASAELQKRKREEEIAKLLEDAEADGRIPSEKKDEWKARLEAGFGVVKPIVDGLAKNPALTRETKKVETSTTGNSGGGVASYRDLRAQAAAELKGNRES